MILQKVKLCYRWEVGVGAWALQGGVTYPGVGAVIVQPSYYVVLVLDWVLFIALLFFSDSYNTSLRDLRR